MSTFGNYPHTQTAFFVHCKNSCDFMISFRYKPLPDLVLRVKEVNYHYRLLAKQHDRLRRKIAAAADKANVVVDEGIHNDLVAITTDSATFLDDLPPDSFQRIFWQQQVEAAAQKDPRAMRWHPLMIRWCLHLRHRLVCVITCVLFTYVFCTDLVEHMSPCVLLAV